MPIFQKTFQNRFPFLDNFWNKIFNFFVLNIAINGKKNTTASFPRFPRIFTNAYATTQKIIEIKNNGFSI